MFGITIIFKVVLLLLFNSLGASANNNSNIINDIDHLLDNTKEKYIIIKSYIFSPENSVNTNFDIYSGSLIAISSKLTIIRNEFFEKILDLDMEQDHLEKVSKINLKFELLNNSISVLYQINKYFNIKDNNTITTFRDYKAMSEQLVAFEKLLHKME